MPLPRTFALLSFIKNTQLNPPLLHFPRANPAVPHMPVENAETLRAGVSVAVRREDLVHPAISGNKYHKLRYNLQEARDRGHDSLLSFGGAYSNHIHALAWAGQEAGFRTIGIIRGEAPPELNPTLQDATGWGMQLHFVDRASYRRKYQLDLLRRIEAESGPFFLVPEGGSNALAVQGCAELGRALGESWDYVCLPCGTGGTLAGLAAGLAEGGTLLGFPVLHNTAELREAVPALLRDYGAADRGNWQLVGGYEFGGYARFDWPLIRFINWFRTAHRIPLDPVYTGKLFYGVCDLIRRGYFPRGSRILLVHTGGLQGIRGFVQRFGRIIRSWG
jgi:1-aminocyclopropane-1-carboxylate deaminase